jgi:glycerol-3-phosphate O-acyltransferase
MPQVKPDGSKTGENSMTQRGRKSAEAQSVVVSLLPGERPEPPAELTAAQAKVWKTTVGALKVGWFGAENFALLAQYCRHVAIADVVAKAITATDIKADLPRFARLGAMQARETAVIISLATKMRLTNQSSRDSRHVKRDPLANRPRPWETGED